MLDADDKPLVDRQVSLNGYVGDDSSQNFDPFASVRIEPLPIGPFAAKTDQQGYVEISGLPVGVPMTLEVQTGSDRESFGRRLLQLNERRPTEVIRLSSRTSQPLPLDLEFRLPRLLFNSKLNDTHGLIVISGSGSPAEKLETGHSTTKRRLKLDSTSRW